jgi:phospholipase/carboxylesterase
MEMPIEWLPAQGAPEQLILLLHGWGSSGADMAPLAQALRAQFPQAAVLAPDGPHAYERDLAAGRSTPRRQWYSVADISPANWPGRVAACLPALHGWVLAQQQRLGVGPQATCLGGFSQGAILSMALAAQHDGLAGRVLAFAGCFTAPPAAAPAHTTLHLFHGSEDSVIPAEGARKALAWMAENGGDATIDIAQGVGHELHPALVQCALQRLQSHIPARTWRAALGAAQRLQAGDDDDERAGSTSSGASLVPPPGLH